MDTFEKDKLDRGVSFVWAKIRISGYLCVFTIIESAKLRLEEEV